VVWRGECQSQLLTARVEIPQLHLMLGTMVASHHAKFANSIIHSYLLEHAQTAQLVQTFLQELMVIATQLALLVLMLLHSGSHVLQMQLIVHLVHMASQALGHVVLNVLIQMAGILDPPHA
jgi:hypothetical protein